MGEQFILKPTPFRKPVTVVVEKHGITTLQGGKSRRIEFRNVEGVYSWPSGYGASLSFIGKDGDRVVVAGGSGPFVPDGKANMRAYYQASSAALKAYAAACPGAEVHAGRSVRENRKTMAFVLVVVMVIAAINVLQDGQVEPFEYAVFPIMLAAVGYVGLTRFNVFKPPPRRPAAVEAAECAQAADEIVVR